MQKSLQSLLWTGAILVGLILAAANLYLGDLNQDEGWYLYAAGLTAHGELPYVDFAYTQAPVLPLVYALAQPLVAHWGVAGGRLFTVLLGLAALLCAAGLSARLAAPGRAAVTALLAVILLAANVYQSYFFTVVKTYALTALFLCAGFLLLTIGRGVRGRWAAFLAALAFSLATGTRISAGVVLPAAWIYLLFLRRERPWQWLWFALGGALACGALFLPFLVMAPESFLFGVLQYHTGRQTGGAMTWLVYRAAFVSRMVQAYFVACLLWAWVLVMTGFRRQPADPAEAGEPTLKGMPLLLWVTAGLITLVHLSAPMPYDDYQAMVYPLFAAALAVSALRLARGPEAQRVLLVTVFLAAVAGSFSSPINQDWFTGGRDRIWWRLKERPALRALRETAAEIRTLAGPDGELLTQDTYLAVEAGRRVPRGLELGPFSYYPDWDEARAQRCHVLNRAMLTDLLRNSGARVAAFSGYGLTIGSPGIRELKVAEQKGLREALAERYQPIRKVPGFGQALTELVIYERK